jgi:hypothetical protein
MPAKRLWPQEKTASSLFPRRSSFYIAEKKQDLKALRPHFK